MKLLILGASGGCGLWLSRLAPTHGHQVTALVRAGTPFPAIDGVRTLRGDVLDGEALREAMRGQELVLSALGIQRAVPANPWSRLVSPATFNSDSMRTIIAAMRSTGVPRIVAISAAGVAESAPRMNGPLRLLVARSNIGVAYRDLARMEELLAQSGLDWMAVRPVTLKNGSPSGRTRQVERYGMTMSITRGSVAQWMLEAGERGGTPALRTPMIAD